MKFDKYKINHYFIYLKGFIYLQLAFLFNKTSKESGKIDIVLYGHNLNGNLKSLYEELKKTNFNFYYLTLDHKLYLDLKHKGTNVLFGLKFKHIKKLLNAKAIITDHGLHFYTYLIGKNNILFFDINHGLPFQKWDKKTLELQTKFTEVWLFSNFHKDIYINTFKYDTDNIEVTGYGRLDYLINFNMLENKSKKIETLKTKYNLPIYEKTILYAPTWTHDLKKVRNDYMQPLNIGFLKDLNEIAIESNFNIIFRPHMNMSIKTKFRQDIDSLDKVNLFPQKNFPEVENFLVMSDLLITDYSSISFDYLLLDRPVLFLNSKNSFPKGLYKQEILRFGKLVNHDELSFFINKYLLEPAEYFTDTTHGEFKKLIYDNFDKISSKNYVKRIEHYLH
tara:strand:- start:553 stop:1728 length:1176 start_codon:yes stop_codon:yes gene_type:complete